MNSFGALKKSNLIGILVLIINPCLAQDAEILYRDNCAECHNAHRLGAMGPALLPGNLKRLRKKSAASVISNGRLATQMCKYVQPW